MLATVMAQEAEVDWRAETPWLLLLAGALAALLAVRGQGGDWHSAITAGLACLAAPAAAVQAMLGLASLTAWCEPPEPPRMTGRHLQR